MLNTQALKELLGQKLSDRDKALLCLAADPVGPRSVASLKDIGAAAGWRSIKNKNVSAILHHAKGKAANTTDGWELLGPGVEHVNKIAGPFAVGSPIVKAASNLRASLAKINDPDTMAFVEEAIRCYEGGQLRAAVVLTWVGAVSVLQDHVMSNQSVLTAFNADAVRRFASARTPFVAAKKKDDLGRLGEADFLTVLEKIGVIGKNLKQELDVALKLRNACGHPNSYKLGEHKVTAHVEDLILNVFTQF